MVLAKEPPPCRRRRRRRLSLVRGWRSGSARRSSHTSSGNVRLGQSTAAGHASRVIGVRGVDPASPDDDDGVFANHTVDCAGVGGDGGDSGAVETAANEVPPATSSFVDESAPAAAARGGGKPRTKRAAAEAAAAGTGGTSRRTKRARRHRRWCRFRGDSATRVLLAVLAVLLFMWISALVVFVQPPPLFRASEGGPRNSASSRRLKNVRTEAAAKGEKKTGLKRRSFPGDSSSGDVRSGDGGEATEGDVVRPRLFRASEGWQRNSASSRRLINVQTEAAVKGEKKTGLKRRSFPGDSSSRDVRSGDGGEETEAIAAPGNRPVAREGMPSSGPDRLQRLQSKRESSVPAAAVGRVLRSTLHSRSTPRRYLFVKHIVGGQGQGNVMNGVLAAHLLGNEFNRTVCLEKARFKDTFLQAFRPLLSEEERKACEKLSMPSRGENVMKLYNWRRPPNECDLRRKMSSEETVIYIEGNTYPRWPHVPDGFFLEHYEPTQDLLSMVPWSSPPDVIVHLRKEDSAGDARQGLDNNTLRALGEALPSDTYLVTNQVTWFDWFAENYNWTNPGWHEVKHSARNNIWGGREERSDLERRAEERGLSAKDLQNLMLWSDWYSMIVAKRVIHTHSDFSLSAAHWMNTPSKTIQGVTEEGQLNLIDEDWMRNGETPRLIDRTDKELKGCPRSVVHSSVSSSARPRTKMLKNRGDKKS